MNKRVFSILISFIVCFLAPQTILSQLPFTITSIQGHKYSYKPSISQRLNGAIEIVLMVPKGMDEFEQYIFSNLETYFRSIGIPVTSRYVNYEIKREYFPTFQSIWRSVAEPAGKYWENSNTLLVEATDMAAMGIYLPGGIKHNVKIYIVDPILNDYWTFTFDLPGNSDKFQKKLKKEITKSYSYNPSFSLSPDYYKSNWNEEIFKQYFELNNNIPFEGIYEGENYKVGVKEYEGKLYIVYLSGASNANDWKSGDIKAILQSTATPTIFKGQWYGKWKQKMNFTITFSDGLMTTYDEDKDPEVFIKLYPRY